MKSSEVQVGAFYLTRGGETVRVDSLRGGGSVQVFGATGGAFVMKSRDLLHTVPDPAALASPAKTKLEAVRAQMLSELERIAAEVRAYGTIGKVDYGHVGSLTEALKALDEMHGFGRAYKAENARAHQLEAARAERVATDTRYTLPRTK